MEEYDHGDGGDGSHHSVDLDPDGADVYWIDLQSHVPQAKRLIREELKNDRL